MEALDLISSRYNINTKAKPPIEIRNMGRNDLGTLFHDLGYRVGAEIGIEQGVYSEILFKANPEMTLYCVDAWEAYKGYRDHVSQERLDGFYADTQERLAGYDARFLRKYSMDAVKDFEDNSLDFVYIDANHELPWVMLDMIEWSKKVKIGGIVSGHDYYKSRRIYTRCHVVYAVDAFMQAFRIRPWFLIGTKEKREGEVRDKSRSWMYVKYEELNG